VQTFRRAHAPEITRTARSDRVNSTTAAPKLDALGPTPGSANAPTFGLFARLVGSRAWLPLEALNPVSRRRFGGTKPESGNQ